MKAPEKIGEDEEGDGKNTSVISWSFQGVSYLAFQLSLQLTLTRVCLGLANSNQFWPELSDNVGQFQPFLARIGDLEPYCNPFLGQFFLIINF